MNRIAASILLLLGATMVALGDPTGFDVPEIDPGSIVSGLALFSGAVLLIRTRRKA